VIDEIPVVQPEEAIRFFREKDFEIGFAWQDVWQEQHARAFTVAKAMTVELLQDIRAEVDRAIAEGLTLDAFRANLRPKLEARGWWGRKPMRDPATGETKRVQLGSPRRLKTIFQVNMRTAYMEGKWERIQRQKAAFPYLRYVSVMDGRERPEHRAWHGTIKPVDDPWWDAHYPPCGWNCRCEVQALNKRMMEREGWTETARPKAFPPREYVNRRTGEVSQVPGGIDPGWAYNVGRAKHGPAPIPAAPGGTVPATHAHVEAFLKPFGLQPGESAEIRDPGGYPHSISDAWLRDAAGKFVLPARMSVTEVGRMAAAIAAPEAAVWRWVTTKAGAPVLMRRLLKRSEDGGGAIRVDVSPGLGWRVQIGRDLVGEQMPPRAPLRAFVEREVAERTPARYVLGPVPIAAEKALRSVKLSGKVKRGGLKAVVLTGQMVGHIADRHGPDSKDRRPIALSELALAPRILAEGRLVPPVTQTRMGARVRFDATVDGRRYGAIFEVRKDALALLSMFRR
jgi:SPP1 gp7 family putative phage head morphogenesis protein